MVETTSIGISYEQGLTLRDKLDCVRYRDV